MSYFIDFREIPLCFLAAPNIKTIRVLIRNRREITGRFQNVYRIFLLARTFQEKW